MSPLPDRRFCLILAGSVLLHGALFVVMAGARQPVVAALPALLASIRLPPVSESGKLAVAAHSATPAAIPQKARPAAIRPTQNVAPGSLPLAGPATPSAPLAPPPALAEPLAPPAAASAPGRPQSELLDGYRQRLGELFARHQEYPRIAALRGWEGVVRLRLKVARKGNLVAVNLDHSSGFEVLDQHALAMLESLASLPPLPEALDLNEIQVVVPVNYKLKKTT